MDSTIKVEWFDFSEAWKTPERYVAMVASLSHGRKPEEVDPQKLTRKLIDLGHESVFEFIRYPAPHDNARKSGLLDPSTLPSDTTDHLRETVGTVRLTVPIYVARQIMRHRAFSYLELSRRYTKPNRVQLEFFLPASPNIDQLQGVYSCAYSRAEETYNCLLEEGEAAQFARAVLPLGLVTTFWMQGDYKAWGNFLVYRLHPAAQPETQQTAEKIWNRFRNLQTELAEKIRDYVLTEWVDECPEIFRPGRRRHLEAVKAYFTLE